MVAPGLSGVTRPCRRHCDETKPVAKPGPLALLPVARSPSRLHLCNRWWALTPPFHPLPAPAFAGRWRDYSLLRL